VVEGRFVAFVVTLALACGWPSSAESNSGAHYFALQMATKTRIMTINEGEEVIIRVNSTKHITLEFPSGIVTVFEEKGVLYTRHQAQEGGDRGSETCDEEEVDDLIETQFIETQVDTQTHLETPPSVVRWAGGHFDDVNEKHMSRLIMEDIEELQIDLFGSLEVGDTQIDV